MREPSERRDILDAIGRIESYAVRGRRAFESDELLSWPVSPGAAHGNTYRETIPSSMLGSRLPGSVYDQTCFESADALGDGPRRSSGRTRVGFAPGPGQAVE